MQNISQAVRVCSRALRSMQTFTTFLCIESTNANKGGDTNFKNMTVSIILCNKFWVAPCYGNKISLLSRICNAEHQIRI